ncbi:hypothetical protein B0H19DRAFT_1058306 [Mycena capillaripes]|nr:hypothetical protein B0H19DRAFT_1058306 [Mycena capillaripes]
MEQPLMLLIRLFLQFPSVAKPVLALIKKLATLSKALPDSVSKATEEDDIRRIMTEVTGDDPQQTFPAAKPKAKKAPSGKETTDKSGKAQPKSKSKSHYYDKAKSCQCNVIATIGPDRAAYAKTLFEHVFARYQATHKQYVSPHTEKAASRATTGRSFFDDVAMIDVDDEPDPVPQKPEYKQFYSTGKTHGKGDINTPLAW